VVVLLSKYPLSTFHFRKSPLLFLPMKKTLLLLPIGFLALTGCGDNRSTRIESSETQEIQYALPQGKMHFDGHGDEKWFAYSALSGVGEYKANGVTQSHLFDDGYFLHTANINIELAEDGYFYEGWLVKGSDVVSTGHLSNYFGDVRHAVRFESETDYTDYTKVVITLEPDDGNPAPAVHVAEATLKHVER